MSIVRRAYCGVAPAVAVAIAVVLLPTAAFAADSGMSAGPAMAEGVQEDATIRPGIEADNSTSAPEATPSSDLGQASSLSVVAGHDGAASVVPKVLSESGYGLRPGLNAFFAASGFTPGEFAKIEIAGPDGQDLSSWMHGFPNPTFGNDGALYFSVAVSTDAHVDDVVRLTVSDQSGGIAFVEVRVNTFVARPSLDVPVRPTAGVVRIEGRGGEPGQVAVVSVSEGSLDEPQEGAPQTDDSLGLPTAGEGGTTNERPEQVIDEVPVVFDPAQGVAFARVTIDAVGKFTAWFVLPAGNYVSDAAVLLRDGSASSDFSDAIEFSVTRAALIVSVPPSPVEVPVSPAPFDVLVQPNPVDVVSSVAGSSEDVWVRPLGLVGQGKLAYTGSNPAIWLAVAAGLTACGGTFLALSRPRNRESKRGILKGGRARTRVRDA